MVFALKVNLKTARIKAGMYQKDVANLINITPNAYAQIENRKRATRGKTAKSICELLNVDFDQVFEMTDERR